MTRTVWLGILLKRACRPAEGVVVSADSSGKGGGGTWVCSVGVSERLKEAGIWTVGTSDHAGSKSLYELDLKGPLAIVLGAEEKGMRRLTMENCDFLATIPMSGEVECLNVSVATGVCLYEAVRQRQSQ